MVVWGSRYSIVFQVKHVSHEMESPLQVFQCRISPWVLDCCASDVENHPSNVAETSRAAFSLREHITPNAGMKSCFFSFQDKPWRKTILHPLEWFKHLLFFTSNLCCITIFTSVFFSFQVVESMKIQNEIHEIDSKSIQIPHEGLVKDAHGWNGPNWCA